MLEKPTGTETTKPAHKPGHARYGRHMGKLSIRRHELQAHQDNYRSGRRDSDNRSNEGVAMRQYDKDEAAERNQQRFAAVIAKAKVEIA